MTNEVGIALLMCLALGALVAVPVWLSCRPQRRPSDPVGLAPKAFCEMFGHKFKDEPVPVHTGLGRFTKWKDELGNPIAYWALQCERCHGLRPTPESLDEANKLEDELGAAMNADRARYGLKPIDWRGWV